MTSNKYLLGDVATFKYGSMPKKNLISKTGYPIYTGYRYVGYYPTYNIDKESVIIVARGVGGTGDVKLCPARTHLTNLSIALEINENILNKKYFYYKYSLSNLRYLDSGSAQSQITINDLKKIDLELPDLNEQKAIANILSSLDDKIAINNKINKNLEELAQTLYKRWFVDFDFPNEYGEPYKSTGGEMVESELGLIPNGWAVKNLGDVLFSLETGNRPVGGIQDIKFGIPSIGAENVIGLGKYDYSKEKLISKDYYNKLSRGKIQDYDVLLYKDGAKLGRKTIVGRGYPHKAAAVNSHVFILRSNNQITQEFLYFNLDQDSMTQKVISLNANSAQPGINQTSLKSLKIVVPIKNEIKNFTQIVQSFLDQIFNNCIENNILSKTRDTLLPKLMSGEIEV